MTEIKLCYDLRINIIMFGIANLVLSTLTIILYVALAVIDSNPDEIKRYACVVVLNIVNLLTKSSLTYGAYKQSRPYFLPYLIVECFALIVATSVCLIYIFQCPFLSLLLFVCMVLWYIWVCNLIYYKMLNPDGEYGQECETFVQIEEPPMYFQEKDEIEV